LPKFDYVWVADSLKRYANIDIDRNSLNDANEVNVADNKENQV